MRDELEVLRDEITLCNLDVSRGLIEPAGAGYIVVLDAPVVDIAAHIEGEIPRRITCRTAWHAEVQMLTWLKRIQQAERKQVRMGRWHDGLTELVKRPLDPSEVSDYLAEQAHRRQVDKLRQELAEVIARKADRRAQEQAEQALIDRYGQPAAHDQQKRACRQRKTEQQLPLTGVATEE